MIEKPYFLTFELSEPKQDYIGGGKFVDVWEIVGFIWDMIVCKKYKRIEIKKH